MTLNTSSNKASTDSLGKQFQHLTTINIKNFSLMSKLNLPIFSLKPLPLVLPLWVPLKSLSLFAGLTSRGLSCTGDSRAACSIQGGISRDLSQPVGHTVASYISWIQLVFRAASTHSWLLFSLLSPSIPSSLLLRAALTAFCPSVYIDISDCHKLVQDIILDITEI